MAVLYATLSEAVVLQWWKEMLFLTRERGRVKTR
jgi:hypothetical protein